MKISELVAKVDQFLWVLPYPEASDFLYFLTKTKILLGKDIKHYGFHEW